ncbi:efflux RND transporter periplasmic adaptor subunit [Vibrio sp. HN007]|uniref:efflux RND transporter periplasmic adaptor subunit n=1 Tax=Vibrio iocasae TaxID=3098914 RepID=UPI0035D52185
MRKFSLLVLGITALSMQANANEITESDVEAITVERVAAIEVVQGTIAERVLAEGLAQGIRREYLSFEKGGRVTLISTDVNGVSLREGSQVKGPTKNEKFGQIIASIDERADKERLNQTMASLQAAEQRVVQAQSNLIRSENNLNLANEEFKRIESIYRKKLIPKKQFDVAKTERLNAEEGIKSAKSELSAARSDLDAQTASFNQAKVELEKTSIYAPFDGVLRTVNIRQGDYFSGPVQSVTERDREASSAVVIVDTSQYEATLNVPAYLAGSVSEGQTVYISSSAFELQQAANSDFKLGRFAKGKVYSVSPSISLDKRSVRIKVHTEEGAEYLQDGMYVSAWIFTSLKEDVLLLPYSAVMSHDNEFYVYVVRDGRAWVTPVQIGAYNNNNVEILSGLKPFDIVVTTGNHKLVHGAHIQVIKEH